ncbi:hypothetical protein Tcan_11269 [Toxocara canis]|uniref:Uncharacterized protein n=1 Tax=Toxocara canis TaxID=6265 RepID=A0A0B2V3Z5_TOXCA|nr:hypothetical protein Tcan_11269 [Toxocara canis]
MLRRAVQSALRNYYSARIVRPAHMSICIDYTEGAPVDNSLSPFLHYRNPSVVLRMTADEEVHRTEPGEFLYHALMMLRRAVQSALRNYYSARIVRPAHMSICIDYTEGAPVDNSLSPFLHYRNPSVVLRMTADEEVHRTEPEQKKPMNREKLLKWIKENCSIADELINDHNEYRPMKAEIRALSSVIPKAVIELESVSKQKATFANLTEVMNLRRKRIGRSYHISGKSSPYVRGQQLGGIAPAPRAGRLGAEIRALSSVIPKAVIELESVSKQKATFANLTEVMNLRRKEKEFRSENINEKFERDWKKMIDSDTKQLYSSVQNFSPISQSEKQSSRTTTPRSPAPSSSTESKTKDVGTMTSFEEIIDWGEPFGTIDFEPMDSKGRINKGIQARGQTENDP